MKATYTAVVWRVSSGWMWAIAGETNDYGCLVAEGKFPLATADLAHAEATEYMTQYGLPQ